MQLRNKATIKRPSRYDDAPESDPTPRRNRGGRQRKDFQSSPAISPPVSKPRRVSVPEERKPPKYEAVQQHSKQDATSRTNPTAETEVLEENVDSRRRLSLAQSDTTHHTQNGQNSGGWSASVVPTRATREGEEVNVMTPKLDESRISDIQTALRPKDPSVIGSQKMSTQPTVSNASRRSVLEARQTHEAQFERNMKKMKELGERTDEEWFMKEMETSEEEDSDVPAKENIARSTRAPTWRNLNPGHRMSIVDFLCGSMPLIQIYQSLKLSLEESSEEFANRTRRRDREAAEELAMQTFQAEVNQRAMEPQDVPQTQFRQAQFTQLLEQNLFRDLEDLEQSTCSREEHVLAKAFVRNLGLDPAILEEWPSTGLSDFGIETNAAPDHFQPAPAVLPPPITNDPEKPAPKRRGRPRKEVQFAEGPVNAQQAVGNQRAGGRARVWKPFGQHLSDVEGFIPGPTSQSQPEKAPQDQSAPEEPRLPSEYSTMQSSRPLKRVIGRHPNGPFLRQENYQNPEKQIATSQSLSSTSQTLLSRHGASSKAYGSHPENPVMMQSDRAKFARKEAIDTQNENPYLMHQHYLQQQSQSKTGRAVPTMEDDLSIPRPQFSPLASELIMNDHMQSPYMEHRYQSGQGAVVPMTQNMEQYQRAMLRASPTTQNVPSIMIHSPTRLGPAITLDPRNLVKNKENEPALAEPQISLSIGGQDGGFVHNHPEAASAMQDNGHSSNNHSPTTQSALSMAVTADFPNSHVGELAKAHLEPSPHLQQKKHPTTGVLANAQTVKSAVASHALLERAVGGRLENRIAETGGEPTSNAVLPMMQAVSLVTGSSPGHKGRATNHESHLQPFYEHQLPIPSAHWPLQAILRDDLTQLPEQNNTISRGSPPTESPQHITSDSDNPSESDRDTVEAPNRSRKGDSAETDVSLSSPPQANTAVAAGASIIASKDAVPNESSIVVDHAPPAKRRRTLNKRNPATKDAVPGEKTLRSTVAKKFAKGMSKTETMPDSSPFPNTDVDEPPMKPEDEGNSAASHVKKSVAAFARKLKSARKLKRVEGQN
ncbi:MAG: hypothetical protein M4579_006987 [Chaenotheca gracillima]|nr:MAG: hypothetical protein M4579_006987 [Chaenotheca gracillima]